LLKNKNNLKTNLKTSLNRRGAEAQRSAEKYEARRRHKVL